MSRLPVLLLFRRRTSSHHFLAKHFSTQPFSVLKPTSGFTSLSAFKPQALINPPSSKMMRRFIGMMSSSPPKENGVVSEENYENAILTLNTLQSNAATIAQMRANRDLRRSTSIQQATAAALLSGLDLDALNAMDIIHVSGTKGKGMTCAFTESILRQAGLKTGFFSSPHLTAVRERIRINGKAIPEHQFARSFFSVYNKLKHLQQDQDHCCEMPAYFRFLTILAFHVFLEEQVDVIILEVGIGGKYDSTNFIQCPTVVGITSLGLEHQSVLGDTLEEIALQKAGIMKPTCPVFTVSTHPPAIQNLLRDHATQLNCPFYSVPPLDLKGTGITLGVDDGDQGVVSTNAGLALHLANQLLLHRHSHIFPKLSMEVTSAQELSYSQDPSQFLPFQVRGLQLCQWDGRFQQIQDSSRERKRITWFLDGAHTLESLPVALQWFNRHTSSSRSLRLLVFNLTGERSPEKLMMPLVKSEIFDLAIFCPFVPYSKDSSTAPDNWSAIADSDPKHDPLEPCKKLARTWEQIQNRSKGVVLSSAEETLDYIRELGEGEQFRIQVLVTGSLHLVGTFLQVLQPNRNDE